jgi:hypothetical protein
VLKIRGAVPTISLARMVRVIQSHNKNFRPEIAWAYYDLAQIFGLDPAAAMCQAIHETGWFTSEKAVKQNNFAGIGVTSNATIGAIDVSIIGGVLRHLSHLVAYAVEARNEWAAYIDNRYDLVKKLYSSRLAVYYTDLNGKWAVPGTNYGQAIEAIHTAIKNAA